MDTGATSHMSNSPGNFSSYVNKGLYRNIIVGNGSKVPIQGTGHYTLPHPFPPLHLSNILHVPSLIKNLLSVRRLTTDNNVSIEFDPFGFDVKDFQTRTPILRCNSTGDLYPLTLKSSSQLTSPSAFASITQDLWHHRLGHPGHSTTNTPNKWSRTAKHSSNNIASNARSSCPQIHFDKQVNAYNITA
ncbi:hypothetical protein E3N88_08234 [Mikania micrantha]|uniref:Retrovirus-related Pol polyprotein from transposon TNT 1-94-like beta-barrel domain-containing protein n=1 Tax=Mikania micrantha TaxID=192012 RepID=A0A5N6PFM4_9ASTR|nr:hypothetical protein E3N88_08234 [Mikania micrantha]